MIVRGGDRSEFTRGKQRMQFVVGDHQEVVGRNTTSSKFSETVARNGMIIGDTR